MPNIVPRESHDADAAPKRGLLERMGLKRPKTSTEATKGMAHAMDAGEKINQGMELALGLSGASISTMLGSDRRTIRERRVIYDKWMDMEADPVCGTAISLLVSAALGGHETSGQLVFIEPAARIKGNKAAENLVAEISGSLTEIVNASTPQIAHVAAWGGDGYARLYGEKGKGLKGIHLDENWLPPMVQAYEQGGRTVGFSVYTGSKSWERLNIMQMSRMKMPRMQFIPQHTVHEKSLRMNVVEDDIDSLPILPSLVGGSLLHKAEKPYDDLYASLVGLVGQRLTDAINEENIGVNLSDMSPEQQTRFVDDVTRILTASRDRAMKAVKTGRPVMEKVKNLFPVSNDKQLFSIGPTTQGRMGNFTIDDVMLHARLLSGALGVDLSMIGFADQMAGGLGEGGFFRTSAHVGERARLLRTSMTDCINHQINVHTALKYGVVYGDEDRPWTINFYGSISALESERQRTRTEAMNGGLLLAQALDALKNMGATPQIAEEYLAKTMLLDADQAKLYAGLMTTKPPMQEGMGL